MDAHDRVEGKAWLAGQTLVARATVFADGGRASLAGVAASLISPHLSWRLESHHPPRIDNR